MTVSKETAYELGVTANFAVVAGQSAAHAGVALSAWAIENIDIIPASAKKVITHVLEHLKEIQNVATVIDEYTDDKIEEFAQADTAGMVEVSLAIGESEILSKMQQALGMSDEEVATQLAAKTAQIAEYNTQEN